MDRFSLKHLLDGEVIHGLKANLAKERGALADFLAHLAEVDERKLHVPAGYESLHDYCMRALHLSKDAAHKRIHAARAALEFPAIFERVAEGALGLSAVNTVAPYLAAENAAELLAEVAFKPRQEMRELLAERFPQAPVPTTIEPIAQPMTLATPPEAGGDVLQVAPAPLQRVVNPLEVTPIAADLYKMQFTMTAAMHDKLQRAVTLFGRRKPVPDEAEILELGLDLLVARLEKKKFAATDRPLARRRRSSEDHIPAEVRRQVWHALHVVPLRDRPHHPEVARRALGRPEQPPPALSGAQPVRGGADVREAVHGEQAGGGEGRVGAAQGGEGRGRGEAAGGEGSPGGARQRRADARAAEPRLHHRGGALRARRVRADG